MFHLNQVNIAGTMTRDADVKYTPSGKTVADISLAINRVWKDDKGNKHEEVTFIEVQAWGRTAEIIKEYTGKGHTIMVEGRLKQDTWKDKESGKNRSKLYVVCDRFHFVSKPKSEESNESEEPPRKQKQSTPARREQEPEPPELADPDDDDVPF